MFIWFTDRFIKFLFLFQSFLALFVFKKANVPLFSTVVPASIFMFLSCRPFIVITTLSTGLVGVEVSFVSWLGMLTVGV